MRSPLSLLFPCVSLLDLFYSWRMDVTTVIHKRTEMVVAVKEGSNLIPVCVLDKATPNLYVDLFPIIIIIIIIIIFSSLNWSITVEHVMTTVNVNRHVVIVGDGWSNENTRSVVTWLPQARVQREATSRPAHASGRGHATYVTWIRSPRLQLFFHVCFACVLYDGRDGGSGNHGLVRAEHGRDDANSIPCLPLVEMLGVKLHPMSKYNNILSA